MVLHKNEFMTHQIQEIAFKQLFSWNFMECIYGRHILFSAKHSELLLGLPYPSANIELMAFFKRSRSVFLSLCLLAQAHFYFIVFKDNTAYMCIHICCMHKGHCSGWPT